MRTYRALLAAILAAFILGAPDPLAAQTTTGSIRGYVTAEGGAAIVGADVRARNTATGVERMATTNTRGFYSLSGLVPGQYALAVRHIGHRPMGQTVQVQIGQDLTLNFSLATSAVQLEELTVSAAPAVETRSTEVATNVTPAQVEALPKSDRNFLALAVLAPGVRLSGDRIGDTRKTITAGAQAAEQINVFIDGASYKNDILQGGVVGQDASRGNPFPRNAVQEFRVITQNYKAEYQKASSAIITATTKSGGSTWAGNVFFNFMNKGLVALDTFQRAEQRAPNSTFRKPEFERYQLGVSGGGPITENLRFFGSYEGNRQNRANRVSITPPDSAALDTIDFASRSGEFDSPFRSTLIFGKLTYLHTPSSTFDLSYNLRHENDIRDFG